MLCQRVHAAGVMFPVALWWNGIIIAYHIWSKLVYGIILNLDTFRPLENWHFKRIYAS